MAMLLACLGTGVATTMGATPTIASAIGFTSEGISAGSTAASMMSGLGGAATPAGGIVANLQSVSATGSVFVSAPAVAATVTAGVAVGAAGYGLYRLGEAIGSSTIILPGNALLLNSSSNTKSRN